MSAQPQLLQQQQQQQSQSNAYDHRADELAELIVYVSDMRRSFGRQLDAQLHIIQQQQERMQLQCRTIDEQREYIDELAWQIRDLRDSIRRVKESLASQQQQQQTANSWPTVAVTALPQPAPRRHQFGGDQPATVGRSRITIEEIIDSDDDDVHHQHNNTNDAHTDENIYEAIEVINTQRSTPLPQPQAQTPTPHAPRNSLNSPSTTGGGTDSGPAETRERRARYALTRNRLTYRTSLPPIADDEAGGALAAAIAQLQVQLRRDNDDDDARESLACGRLSEMSALDGFESVLLRAAEQRSFRRNSQRGSSKVACSMVPNIEEEYLPDEDDDGDRATSNGMPTVGEENGHGGCAGRAGSGGSKVRGGSSVVGTSSCAIGHATQRDVNSAPSCPLPPTNNKRGQLDK